MKLLLTGSHPALADALIAAPSHMASKPVLELRQQNLQQLQVSSALDADYLIFSDALNAHDAESRQALQWQFNQYLELAEQQGLVLVFLSSSAVFKPGRKAPYLETEEADAQSAYGQWLWSLEEQIREHQPQHLILRTGHLQGSLEDEVWQQLQAVKASQWHNNNDFSPTHYDDLARALVAILLQLQSQAPRYGTYHYVSGEATSPLAFSKALCQALALKDKRFDELELSPSDGEIEGHALLNCDKVLHTFGVKQRPWRSYLTQLSRLYLS